MTDFDLLQQRLNLANALKERPDAFARRTKIAAALQKPPGLINADDENLYDVDSTMRALDGRPVLLKTIRDNSAFAKLAHDDFERLANIEHLATLKQERLRREREANRPWFMHGALDEAWANIRKIPKAAWAGKNDKEVEDLRYTLQELEKAGTLTEEGRARIEADIKIHENQRDAAFEEIADINRSIADNSPEDLNIWQKMGRGAVTSLPQMAAAAGITMVSRNPTLGALAMGYGVKETSTAEARIAGLDYDAAQRKGMIDGAAEAAFEILPLGKMMGLYGRGAAQEGRATLKELGKTVASEVAGENATQLIQDANNLWHGLDPVWQKAIAEHGLFSPESLKIQGERQLIASGAAALTSGTLSAPALIANMRRSQEQDITNLTAMTDAARASKLNQRAPDVFRGWTEQIEENADIQHYYVDGNALHQSGLVAALEEALPDRVGEIRQALATGGTVQIPAADILTKIAPDKGLEDAITPHLRTADGLSLHELETTGQAELEGAITENAARAEQAAAQQTETDAIRDDFAAQLTATGRITRDAALQNAELPAAFYQTVAERLGISVSEAYEKYKLKVVGEPLVGLNQPMTQGFQWEFGQRRGLFGMADIPVTEISGKELGQDERAIRTNLNEHLKVYAEGGLTNRDTGWDLRISSEDRKKLAKWFGATLPSLQSQAALEEIVENAVLAESHPDSRHENSDVIGIHRLYAPVSIDGKLHRAKLTVRDYQSKSTGDKTRLRRLEAIEIENAPMGTLPMPEANLQTTAQPTSGRLSLSVRELLRDSKRDDGTAWDFTDNTLHQNADAGSKRGAFDPDTNTIALLEKADLSTFIHELGHFYFETLTRIANDLRARDNAAGGGTLTEGEIRLLKDADTLLGKAELTLDDWNQMTLKERRSHHENIARQFEAYLMEGKAPSVELQGIFSRLRSWLFAVYKKLTALNVQLDDDVRQVFDRLLASDEAIQIAEQNRSMMPLFSTPEAVGMTAEQFADYQRQFQGASDAALDEMSLRMLADAKAIGRLKHKALKAKTKEAKILRGETEIEARRAIMAQPVYRVWQMLTGKMNADTTIASNKWPWTDAVAPEHDDLFTAIAKLGGINRQEIENTWGFDPADKISPVKPGFFVLRREGGQSLDGMRQALVQYGYLTESDSLNDFYELFEAQRRGDSQYSNRHIPDPGIGKTGEHAHLHDLPAFRLDYASLAEMGYGDAQIAALGRKVKKKGGIHPDLLAELVMDADGNPVYDSGDALVQALLAAPEPKSAVRAFTDRIMLERHGELATPEAISEAADMAAHNDLRLRVLATEYNALAQASGGARLVQSAARQLAAQAIGQKRIRDLSPAQYTRMETRAAKAALAAMKKGDIATAAAEKRNQVLQASLARAAHEAKVEVKKLAMMLRRMNRLNPKEVAIEEREQIEALLERFDLRDQSGKALDRRQTLAEWVQAQREQGIEPDIAPEMLDELKRQPWQTLTVDGLRGLADTLRQIEHRGKMKNQLLLEQKQQDLNVAKEEISETVKASGNGKIVDNSTPATWLGQRMAALRRFGWMHTKASTVFYILDGGQRNGPTWRYFGKLANARANFEAAERARLSEALMKISAPLFKRKGLYKRSIRSDIPDRNGQPRVFTPMQVFTVALNMGNAGNLQRLLDGNHWTREQVERLTANLTGDEWRAVQDIWNLFESMKEQVAAKERRVNGIEPQWVEAVPLTVTSIDGETLHLRGGYYPVKYDAGQSQQAEQFQDAEAGQVITNAAFTSATTRRSYTKARAAAVKDRPLLLDISVMYDGLNEIVHDLAWHEFLIDANRLIRSHRVDSAIRDYHGAEYVRLIKDWLQDIAAGDKIPSTYGARMVAAIRQNVSFAGLAFNVVSALKQLSGLPNSIVRVGAPDILAATLQYMRRGRAMTREAVATSAVMENRARTRFRELNEVRNSLRRQGRVKQQLYRWGYAPLLFFQQQVDVITWHGEYHKQLAAGMNEADAVALADQAVLDAQGGGELKDLSAIERDPVGKIFTVFYSYMNTVLNLGIVTVKGRASIGRKAAALLTLFTVPAIIDTLLGTMLTLGDDDDDDETLGQKLVEGQIGYLMGLTVLTREASGAAKALFGVDKGSYKGPTAFRFFDDLHKAAKQIGQGEMDEAMLTSIINLSGDFGLPSAQINRSIKGIKALEEGKTDNPLAVAVGYKEKK
ncbi:hypothetical protein [Cardiobacterium hominis]|uniref:LPD3 domain-containing protein n=1 Tax=Cardiobacterium hominis TaxID=2718 RepID=UPI0028D07E7B|nr:hypothetical protein [Cardiobacterium hominis]